jgi:hypothetical protein
MPMQMSPRVNVTVTEEQHALLLELARLDPDTRSAAAFLRALLDQATPLLRKTVPMMRAAAEELDTGRSELRSTIRDFISELQQSDLLDAAPGTARTERSEGARAKRRASRG